MTAAHTSGRRGSAMLEFALISLVFLSLLIGAMEGARGVWTYMTLAHGARDAARYAMVRGGDDPIEADDLKSYLLARSPGLQRDLLKLEMDWEPDSSPGSVLEISLAYDFRFVASPLFLSSDRLTLATSSRVLVAH